MKKTDIADTIKTIIQENLGISREEVDSKLDSDFASGFGADSLDLVEMVMEIEDQLDINIPDDDSERLRTANQLIEYVEKLVDEK